MKKTNTCPTCGAKVKVVGKTTMHYEPVEEGNVKRPERKKLKIASEANPKTYMSYELGYNQACDDWEAFMPSLEELLQISAQAYCTKRNSNKIVDPNLLEDIARAIHDQLMGEE